MIRFAISMFWRAAISKNDIYDGMQTTYAERTQLWKIFHSEDELSKHVSFSVALLKDRTGYIGSEALAGVIIAPSTWTPSVNGRERKSFFMVAEGFLINLTIPAVPKHRDKKKYFWTEKAEIVSVPTQIINDFPPYLLIFEKHLQNLKDQEKRSLG